MKKTILTAVAVAAMSLSAASQGYVVKITPTEGTPETFPVNSLSEVRFVPAPRYTDFNNYFIGEYSNRDNFGEYAIVISNGPVDQTGQPTEAGGISILLALVNEQPSDMDNISVPAGYYRCNNGLALKTCDITRSAVQTCGEEGDVTNEPIIGGTVDVRRSGETYDVRAELTTMSGIVNARFRGRMPIEAHITSSGEFTEDVTANIDGAQGRFYGSWTRPFADDMTLQLYTGDGTKGYWINIPVNMPKVADPMNPVQHLADGVYKIDPREIVSKYTYMPFTMELGRELDMWGSVYPVGTYVIYTGDNAGENRMSLICDGTMTVSDGGTKISLDLINKGGKHIRAEYSGNVTIKNFCDNDANEIKPIDTLTGDYALTFTSVQKAVCYAMGSYVKEGLYNYIVQVTDPNMAKGDFVQLELCSTSEDFPDGTYTIDDSFTDFSGIRGHMDYGGVPDFSVVGNLEKYDAQGYQEIQACVGSGTVTFETVDGGKKITFNLVSADGHKITGTNTGSMQTFKNY